MKQIYLFLPLMLLYASSLYAAAPNLQEQAMDLYCKSQFAQADPLFRELIDRGEDVKNNEIRYAQCVAARALQNCNAKLLKLAATILTKHDPLYRPIKGAQKVVVAAEGFGDTVMFASILALLNEQLKKENKPEIILHLENPEGKAPQSLLKNIMVRSGVASTITTGDLNQHEGKSILPLIAVLKMGAKKVFTPRAPYLVAKPEAVAFWEKELEKYPGPKVIINWISGKVKVLGGRELDRDISAEELITLILEEHPNAHIFSVQGQPNHKIVTESTFKEMSKEEQEKNIRNVISDEHAKHLIQVVLDNGRERHGAFEDTLALFTLIKKYYGSDTAAAHFAANAGADTTVILPLPEGRDWRWSQNSPKSHLGEPTPWYPEESFNMYEGNMTTNHEMRQALLKQLSKVKGN